jgi:hypothetical protein
MAPIMLAILIVSLAVRIVVILARGDDEASEQT